MTTRIDTSDFTRFAAKLKTVSPKVRNGVRKRLRTVAKPLGQQAVQVGSEAMPQRGGLGSYVASKGRNPVIRTTPLGVTIVLGKKGGPQIGRLDEGSLRHPTYGHRPWIAQDVPAGSFSKVIEDGADDVRVELTKELNQIMRELG